MDLHEVPKKFQYITVDSNFVNGTNNTFSLDLNLESNLHVEDMTKVLGIKMVDFYITQVGAQEGGTPLHHLLKLMGLMITKRDSPDYLWMGNEWLLVVRMRTR